MSPAKHPMNLGHWMTTSPRHPVFVLFAFSLLFLTNCSSPKPAPQADKPEPRVVDTQHGIASLYTDHRTASGERFSAAAFSAAHRHWPLGCMVRCTNVHNGRWVVVRINDRGPYIRGRIIDLTPKAADAIGLTRAQGICRVRIDRLQ
ncbi:MAG: septal ring lytic transglycosylase RlpA family protein [Prosthecobacter sp.]